MPPDCVFKARVVRLAAAVLILDLTAAMAQPGVVARLDLSSVSSNAQAAAVFFPGRSLMAVSDPAAKRIQIVDTRTAVTVSSVSLSASPGSLALSPDGRTLAALLLSTGSVALIETTGFSVRATVAVVGVSYRPGNTLVFSPDGARLFASDQGLHAVVVIDPAIANLVRIIDVGRNPAHMGLQPQGNFLAVINTGQGGIPNDTISLINVASLIVQFTVLTGVDFDDSTVIRFRSDGQAAFIPSAASGKLILLDMSSFNARTLTVAAGTSTVLVNAAGTRLWVGGSTSDTVAMVDISNPASPVVLQSFSFERLDFGLTNNLVFGSDESTIFLPASESRELIGFSALTGEVRQRVKLDFQPGAGFRQNGTNILQLYGLDAPALFYVHLNAKNLVLPVLRESALEYTGLAFVNVSGGPVSVGLTAYTPGGALVTSLESVNPSFLVLDNTQQKARLARQIFNLTGGGGFEGWINAVVPDSGVSVFFLQGDLAQTRLDGAVPEVQPATRVFLTRASLTPRGAGTVTNRVHIINPNVGAANIILRRFDASGQERGAVARQLPARGKLSESVESLFGSSLSLSGYLRVDANLAVSAYQELQTATAVFGLLHQQAAPAGGALYAAQMASGGRLEAGAAYFSELNLINTGGSSASLQVLAAADDGQPIRGAGVRNPVNLLLQPGQQNTIAVDELFGLPAAATDPYLTAGSLIVSGQTANVIGDLVFGDAADGRFASSLGLIRATATRGLIAQLAEGPSGDPPTDFFTGAGFLNPSNTTATTVDLQAFSAEGSLLGSASIRLGAQQRSSRTVAQWIPAVGTRLGGYLRFTTSGPGVVAFAVFGDDRLNFLAAVPPFIQ